MSLSRRKWQEGSLEGSFYETQNLIWNQDFYLMLHFCYLIIFFFILIEIVGVTLMESSTNKVIMQKRAELLNTVYSGNFSKQFENFEAVTKFSM